MLLKLTASREDTGNTRKVLGIVKYSQCVTVTVNEGLNWTEWSKEPEMAGTCIVVKSPNCHNIREIMISIHDRMDFKISKQEPIDYTLVELTCLSGMR